MPCPICKRAKCDHPAAKLGLLKSDLALLRSRKHRSRGDLVPDLCPTQVRFLTHQIQGAVDRKSLSDLAGIEMQQAIKAWYKQNNAIRCLLLDLVEAIWREDFYRQLHDQSPDST